MAFSDVSTFLGKFDGGARPNRYRINITGSNTAGAGVIPDTIEFLCRATSIPASILANCDVPYMGRTIKISGDRQFDDWSITVFNNISFDLRVFFEKWSNGMLKHFANITDFQEDSTYLADGYVEQLDRNENVINKYEMKGIFPISVSDIPLAYDSNNSIEEFSVTFAVNYWTATTKGSTDAG
jgi:hypothetical protein